MSDVLLLVESNTTGTGELLAEYARDLGVVPHLASVDAARYGYPARMGIPVHPCDTSSPDAVLEICRRLGEAQRVVGVLSSSEYYIDVAARVARALGLPGEDPAAVTAARRKDIQRGMFAARGIGSPDHRTAASVADAVAAARAIGPPVVVKPVDRSGSLGVRRCDTVAEVAAHAASLLGGGHRDPALPVLVEAYLAGPEYSVEVLAGEVRAIVAKTVDESLGFLETGHDVPAEVAPPIAEALCHSASAAVEALGLTWGAAHVELRLAGGRACVVEVNPRLAGGMIPVAVTAATGQDLLSELVARTIGRLPPARSRVAHHASIRFLVPRNDGTVRSVPDPGSVRTRAGVVTAVVTARPGLEVVRRGTFLDRLGYVIAAGPDAVSARTCAEQAAAALEVDVEPTGKVVYRG